MSALSEFVERSRRAQGLPPKIEDPGTLARVAALVVNNNGKPERDPARSGAKVEAEGGSA